MAVKKNIGELLSESGLVTRDQIEKALADTSFEKGERLGERLVAKGFCDEIDIAQTLAFQMNLPFVDLSTLTLNREVVGLLDEKLSRKHSIIVISRLGKTIKLAMSDPMNFNVIDDARFFTGLDVEPCVATATDIGAAITRNYESGDAMDEVIGDLDTSLLEVVSEVESGGGDVSELVRKSSAPPILKMVDSIIIHAMDNRASDIHIEPHQTELKMRIRVDGLLRETMQFPKWVHGPIISRIKIMSKLDIAERRVPQDGRIKVRLGDKNLDLRVSTLPTQYGEKIVMRLLDSSSAIFDLESMGFDDDDLATMRDIVERPQGVVISTGPTGSGKSSTLYGIIQHIVNTEINIVTIEDPIEYELNGVSQVAVNEKAGITFANTLRAVLRQDPDVVLVGEMRDEETAVTAYQASLTGHLVLSTLHTNDAVGCVTRLVNIGVPSYMIASALNGVVAQRLLRRICENCKVEYRPTEDELTKIRRNWLERIPTFYKGEGCKICENTGYKGRVGIYEIFRANKRIRHLIASEAPEEELRDAATESGMKSMQEDGVRKVAAGITTINELMRVIYMTTDENYSVNCPWCNEPIQEGMEECFHCGRSVKEKCPKCDELRDPKWESCPHCSYKFSNPGSSNG